MSAQIPCGIRGQRVVRMTKTEVPRSVLEYGCKELADAGDIFSAMQSLISAGRSLNCGFLVCCRVSALFEEGSNGMFGPMLGV